MKYEIMGSFVIGTVIVLIIIILKLKKKKKIKIEEKSSFSVEHPNEFMLIKPKFILEDEIKDKSKLIEIKDNKLLEHINQAIPGFVQIGNALNNIVQVNGMYRVIIPKGAKLSESSNMIGAFRGIFHGSDGIKGHANLISDNNGLIMANSLTSVMAIASMVVGQYYMAKIDKKLSDINSKLSKISSFQNNEYKAKVLSLVSSVKVISDFKTEIFEKKELLKSQIIKLDRLEEKCTELLGQANLTIINDIKKEFYKYKEYENVLESIQNWCKYQNILIKTMYEISELRYTLNCGETEKEYYKSNLLNYLKYVDDTNKKLEIWQDEHIKRFKIDIERNRREEHFILKLLFDDWKYEYISEKTSEMIRFQKYENQREEKEYINSINKVNLYDKDVQLISDNGKIYYYLN
ncbi:hypothetical protein [Leptotrichia wadei]|uniref:hypothetical protein n=1 Tax=Leptotrichia wadei TaxID=157687 RepID=UPI0028D8A8BA|nr:hypothetical protein [Leptotrichia wadei]